MICFAKIVSSHLRLSLLFSSSFQSFWLLLPNKFNIFSFRLIYSFNYLSKIVFLKTQVAFSCSRVLVNWEWSIHFSHFPLLLFYLVSLFTLLGFSTAKLTLSFIIDFWRNGDKENSKTEEKRNLSCSFPTLAAALRRTIIRVTSWKLQPQQYRWRRARWEQCWLNGWGVR